MDEYTLEDFADDEEGGDELGAFVSEEGHSDGSIWDRLLLNRISDESYDQWVHGSLLVFLVGVVLLILTPLLWSISGIYLLILGLMMMVIAGGLVYILLGQPSPPELKEQIITWKRQAVNRIRTALPFLENPEIEEEEEEEGDDESGMLDLHMPGEEDEEEEEGLTMVDTHLESAVEETLSPLAQAEAFYAERSDEEWMVEGIVPPKVAARVALQAGLHTKELTEYLVELMNEREEAQKQRHTEQCNLMEAVIGNLQKLYQQLDNLVETWPEEREPENLLTIATRTKQFPLIQPLMMGGSSAMIDGKGDEPRPPSLPTESDLLAVDTSTIPKPELQQKVGDSVIVEQVNSLMAWPFASLLQSREVDEMVLDILSGTDASYWRIRNLRVAKTRHKDLRLSPEEAEEMVRRLDGRLKTVRGFDDPALRAGLIMEGLADPFYRLCIIKIVLPDGEGEPVEPDLDDYSRVAAATGLDSWLELLRQGELEQITRQLRRGESGDLTIDYYLLAPIAQKKLKEALLSEYVKKQRQDLAILLDPGSDTETTD